MSSGGNTGWKFAEVSPRRTIRHPRGVNILRPDLLEARLFLMLLEKIERLIHEEIPRPS
jgi:hypothetical protein